MQAVTLGIASWSAATIGFVDANRPDDEDKNRLCPPIPFSGAISDAPCMMLPGLRGVTARLAEPDVSAWNESTRLNMARGLSQRMDDPAVQAAIVRMMQCMEPAMTNLERLVSHA